MLSEVILSQYQGSNLGYVSLALEWVDRSFHKVLFPMELVRKGGEKA